MNISVIIPTFNRYELLKRALASIFIQTHLPYEVIVIDDGSTDNTLQIQQDFPTIKYFYQENSGVSSARNLGIKKSTSDWIAFLDSDDEWHENKLEEQVVFHKTNPDILMSYADERWIRDGVEVKIPKKFRKFGGDIFSECLSHCIIAPSATLMHKDILNAVGTFDERLEVCEDYDLWLRVAESHKIGLIDKKLITKYAGHDDQLSFKHWGMDRFRVIALEKLLEGMGEIPSWHTLWVRAGNDGVGRTGHPKGIFFRANDGEGRTGHPKGISFRANDGEAGSDGVEEVLNGSSSSFRATTRNLVIDVLVKKYELLLKGAIKYDKIHDIQIYEKRLRELNE